MQTSQQILKQLGGNRFLAMIGAKNLSTDGNDLTFKIMRNPKKITHVTIKLNPSDNYDIDFFNVNGMRLSTIDSARSIYADNLQQVFADKTGLDTHL